MERYNSFSCNAEWQMKYQIPAVMNLIIEMLHKSPAANILAN